VKQQLILLSTTIVVINPEDEQCEICEQRDEILPTEQPTGTTEQCNLVDEIVDEVVNEETEEETDIEENGCGTEQKRSIETNENIDVKTDIETSENENKKITNKRKMENFKLISAINTIARRGKLTEEQAEFNAIGMEEMRKSGEAMMGDIYIPMGETRAVTAGGVGMGIENIGETKSSLTLALQPNLILQKAGAKYVSGLVNDFSLPSYSSTSSLWAGEVASATDGTGVFAEQVMKPKRLTTFVDVSLQFLAQDSNDANTQLIASLQESISQKLEKTILGTMTGSTIPAGIFAGVVPTISGVTYADITALEGKIEDLNVNDYSFIVSNKAKAVLKSTVKNQVSFVYDGGEIDGYPTFNSGNVYGKGIVAANFNDLWIGQWGSVVLTIDNISQMMNGNVRIVINAFYDAAWVRPSYVVAQLA